MLQIGRDYGGLGVHNRIVISRCAGRREEVAARSNTIGSLEKVRRCAASGWGPLATAALIVSRELPEITIQIDGYVPIIIDPNDERLQAKRDGPHKRIVIESIAMDKKGAFLPNADLSHKLDTTLAAAGGRASR
jgi:hypothetical protein